MYKVSCLSSIKDITGNNLCAFNQCIAFNHWVLIITVITVHHYIPVSIIKFQEILAEYYTDCMMIWWKHRAHGGWIWLSVSSSSLSVVSSSVTFNQQQQLSGKPVSFALYVCRVNVHCLENYLSGSEYSFYENVTIRLYNDFTLSYKFI